MNIKVTFVNAIFAFITIIVIFLNVEIIFLNIEILHLSRDVEPGVEDRVEAALSLGVGLVSGVKPIPENRFEHRTVISSPLVAVHHDLLDVLAQTSCCVGQIVQLLLVSSILVILG